jgi:hypothetical protein
VVTSDPSGLRGAAYGMVEVGFYTAGLDDLTDRTSPLPIGGATVHTNETRLEQYVVP